MTTTARIFAVLALALLTACGGSGNDGPWTKDVAGDFTVSNYQGTPLVRNFDSAGTYTLTLTGNYAPDAPYRADSLDVWYSFSGQGNITSGNDEPSYAVAAGQTAVAVNQTITITLTGAGPWQMRVLCANVGPTDGTMSGLTLFSQKE